MYLQRLHRSIAAILLIPSPETRLWYSEQLWDAPNEDKRIIQATSGSSESVILSRNVDHVSSDERGD